MLDTTVGVAISDESAIASPITLAWTGPTSGSTTMLPDDNEAYGPVATNYQLGVFSFTVTVTDIRGNTTTLESKFTATLCIG